MSEYSYRFRYMSLDSGVEIDLPELRQRQIVKIVKGLNTVSSAALEIFNRTICCLITNRELIPYPQKYCFPEFTIKTDWQTELRINLSNWFIKNTKLKTIQEIENEYLRLSKDGPNSISFPHGVTNIFDINKPLIVVDVLELMDRFDVEMEITSIQMKLIDNN